MSDDIRVYWDKYLEVYSIVIDDIIIHAFDNSDQQFNSYMSGSDLTNDDELVYDSAEHEDYSLIDENLVVPDVANNAIIPNGDLGWKAYDTEIWIDGYSRHKREHEERTA